MAKILICMPRSDSDRYLLTAGSEVASMEAANLKKQQPGDWWRMVDPANSFLVVQQLVNPVTGTFDPWNLIAPLYNDGSSTGTWRIRTAATLGDLTADPTFDTGSMSLWPTTGLDDWPWIHSFYYNTGVPRSEPFTRIDFTDAANFARVDKPWLQAGRYYQCMAYQPTYDLKVGWGLKYKHDVQKEVTQGGQIYPMPGPQKTRVLRFQLQFQSEDEMFDNAFEIDRNRGGDGDVLIIRDRTSRHVHRHTIYGLFSDLGEIINSRGAIFDHAYAVEEMPQ